MHTPDRKSTRLNSSHVKISYAVFCLKKKKKMANACRPAITRGKLNEQQRRLLPTLHPHTKRVPPSSPTYPCIDEHCILFFFFDGSGNPRDLHSFPTRRSSD